MDATLIISAIIRLWGLSRILLGLFSGLALPLYFMLPSNMPESIITAYKSGFRSSAIASMTDIIAGLIFWICAPYISAFILKSLRKEGDA